jgi:hypothetical protein
MANESINLDLSLEEINVILGGLGELPAKASMGVIQKIQQQAGPQVQPEPVEAPEEGEEA